MNLSNLSRTLRTVRHLRPSQVYWRLRYLRERRRPAVVPDVPDAIELCSDFPDIPLLSHSPGPGGETLLEQLERGHFEHLHLSRRLGREQTDWLVTENTRERLWTITLHYHAWAWELAELVRSQGPLAIRADILLRHYLADWIARCELTAPGSRNLAWNTFAIATRIGWWCQIYRALDEQGRREWGDLEPAFLRSLWCHAAFLYRHLEWDVRGNHLLRNLLGLAWAARFFAGDEPRRWLQAATRGAVDQVAEQVLDDGGHFERSPMYHVHVMEDVFLLALLLEDPSAQSFMRQKWHQMADYLGWVRHPDGQIPLLNDGGFNGVCSPRKMLEMGSEHLQWPLDLDARRGNKFFADCGLAVYHGNPWSVFFDVGPISVDYQPGHAHADNLTFEASYAGQRLFVDPGCFNYDQNESRRYDRATESHNTICIDETDSSEMWHIFRAGRRAQPIDVRVDASDVQWTAAGSHTGYDRLKGRPRHQREIQVSDGGLLQIVDRVVGTGEHTIQGGVLIHPAWSVRQVEGGWELRHGDRCLRATLAAEGLSSSTQERSYRPEYGWKTSCQRLSWRGALELPCEIVFRVEACSPTGG